MTQHDEIIYNYAIKQVFHSSYCQLILMEWYSTLFTVICVL